MALFFLLLLPLLALAQNASQTNQTVVTSTSLTTIVGLGPNRQISTTTSTLLFTSTLPLTPAPQPSGNGTSGNGTLSGNSTISANSTSKAAPLPTAPSNVDGGGDNGAAPIPGQTGVGGVFGPDDQYIAAATALKYNALAVGAVGVVLGGALVAF